ncbi:hypothetical protein ACVW0Y_002982 [Pseudomonas sp. TE3786]
MRLDAALPFLKRYRYLILALMVTASLTSVFMRFSNDSQNFWGMLLGHALFAQAIFAYLRGSTITIGPGSLGRDAHPAARAALAALALIFYLLLFAYEGDKHPDSIYERRPSDWTMPTREEFRREAGQ